MKRLSTQPAFPVAAQTYFRATNLDEQRSKFLLQPMFSPIFTYSEGATPEIVESRIQKMSKLHPQLAHSLDIVSSSLRLQHDDSELNNFRKLNEGAYGAPSAANVDLILGRISSRVVESNRSLWREILRIIDYDDLTSSADPLYEEEFELYRGYLLRYLGGPLETAQTSLSDVINSLLALSGLSSRGWQVRLKEGRSPARTVHRRKYIAIGRDYRARTSQAALRIAIHEVYGHALRGPQDSIDESEGFAVLLEQLLSTSLKYRRSYRYLAVALGWGVRGRRLEFREVHEVIWRIMVINSKYSISQARTYAFDECYRAFRGGKPDLPGAVFLKDAIYFDANIRVWQSLFSQVLCYNEFVDCIEGRREVLS